MPEARSIVSRMRVRATQRADLPALERLSAKLGYPSTAQALAGRFEALAKSPADALLVAGAGDFAGGGDAV